MIASPDNHPSTSEWQEFIEGRLDGEPALVFERHLESCRACCDRLQNLGQRTDAFLAQLRAAASEREDATDELPPTDDVQAYPPITEAPGTSIGPYRLVRPIGEGGFGVVYLAEQSEPVRRQVALKIIKPGMDTALVIGRFEAERQALAMMDHPNIARVFDAGSTSTGRPYFVMELVHGAPITEYCDDNHLAPRDRLGLFLSVCQAIAHAHQKGVIHRDVKPSNVMVTLYDGQPTVKVIDFGVAKATESARFPLTERTVFTQHGTIVGTFEYMSPEQAGTSALGVDTRSDIYSLGVLLYELLTGTTPLERGRLAQVALTEKLRLIQDEEPQKPSTRLNTTTQELATIAANRQMEPVKLARLLRGELDWIVMKCLEKDRTRRYQTANALARDLERYLNNEPVEAGPPSATYRLQKLAQRHRKIIVTAGAFVILLIAGTIISAVEAFRATRAEDRAVAAGNAEGKRRQEAEAQRERAVQAEGEAVAVLDFFRTKVLAAARPQGQDGGLGTDITVRAAVQAAETEIGRTFADQPAVEAAIRYTLGQTYLYLGDPKRAILHLKRARELRNAKLGADHPATLTVMNDLAMAYQEAGRASDAVRLMKETLTLQRARLGADHPETLNSMNNLAAAYFAAGQVAEAGKLWEGTLALMKGNLGRDHPETLRTMQNLAVAYHDSGRLEKAIPLYRETLELQQTKLGPDHPDTLSTTNGLAMAYRFDGRVSEALPLFEETLKLRKAKLGADHPDTLWSMANVATTYQIVGRRADALRLFENTVKLQKAKLGPDHPDTLVSTTNLAEVFRVAGRVDDALPLLQSTLKFQKSKLGLDHPDTLTTMNALALAFQAADRPADALPLAQETLRMRKKKLGPDHPHTLASMDTLALAFQKATRRDDAIHLFEETRMIKASKLGADHPETLKSMHHLAVAYDEAMQFPKAQALFVDALAGRQRKLGPEHPDTLDTLSRLGNNLLEQGDYAKAEPLLQEAYGGLGKLESQLGAVGQRRRREAAQRLATLYAKWGKPDRAKEWSKKLAQAESRLQNTKP
jgi:serine/threonine protein kinase